MMFFKLLAGFHIGADKTQKPDDKGKYPSKTYKAGESGNDVVESDMDLEKKLGREKFQRMPDDYEPVKVRRERQMREKGDNREVDESGYIIPDVPGATGLNTKSSSGPPVHQPTRMQDHTNPQTGTEGEVPGKEASSGDAPQPQQSQETKAHTPQQQQPQQGQPQGQAQTKTSIPLPPGVKPPKTKEEYHAVLDQLSHAQLKTLAQENKLQPGNKSRAELIKMLKEEDD